MSELTPEEERARKLEEAKKRVEELKKKNKNKKNKKKKDKEDLEAAEVKTETETELEPTDTNVSESPVNSDEQPVVEEAKAEEKAEINPDAKGNDNNEEKSEKESVKNKEDTEEEALEKGATDIPNPAEEVSKEASVVQQKEEEPIEAKSTDEVEELFGGNDDKEKDFLSTIQEQKSQDEVINLKEEVSKLKDQVKQLKFVNIDQESSIEELEEQISIMKSQLNDKTAQLLSVQQELSTSRQEVEQLRATRSSQLTPVEFSSFDRHSPSKFEPSRQIQHPTTDPVLLAKWKNWNVDMTNWRSVGVGPVVEF
ncbi:Bug1 [Kluyveromyces lactis]|nr:Bug1 [Kluyveromyces lactis]